MAIFNNPATEKAFVTVTGQAMEAAAHRTWYQLLEAYYEGNGVYDVLNNVLGVGGYEAPELKPIRMPAQRVVDFYADLLWPGELEEALPFKEGSLAVQQAVRRILDWSNWQSRKQRAARWLALYGDLFIKVEAITGTTPAGEEKVTGVYHRLIEPTWISDVDTDPRGNVVYCRIDMPIAVRDGDEVETKYYTELWQGDRYQVWAEHDKGLDAGQDDLGSPTGSGDRQDTGIGVAPIVYGMLRDAGGDRGNGAFAGKIDPIDEINRKATRLAQMLYRWNKPLLAVMANAIDPSGRPLPAPRVGSSDTELDLSDDKDLIKLPGMSTVEALVPKIDFNAALAVLESDVAALREDLPELMYYRIQEIGGQLSGIAIQRLLKPAAARLLEARGNAEAALVAANKIAITLAQSYQLLPDIDGLVLEGDGLNHSFRSRPVFPVHISELADPISKLVAQGMPLTTALREVAGWTDDQIERMMDDKADDDARKVENAAAAALEAMDNLAAGRGANGEPPAQMAPAQQGPMVPAAQ